MHKFLPVVVIVSMLGLVVGCGQKGPLILPEEDARAKPQDVINDQSSEPKQ